MIKLEEKLKQLQANCYMLQLYMETRSKAFSDNLWLFGWPWLGTHVYKMTPKAFDYHSISYGAHAQCAPFDTVRITSIRRTNRHFSVKLANNREEGVIYRSEKLASSHFTYITHYGQRKGEQQEIAMKHDEAHFWLNGYVNKQKCRIWSEANPQVYVETPLHTEKLTVWCALWAGGILLQKR
ncbi:hypothetical protein TNCV_4767071 [Trichonephila clavipes]|nr:hypothetical protein TNCV_4767071 [Trichonephila clavipes]